MGSFHEFEGSKGKIKKEEEHFVAKCECGWSSGPVSSKEEAIVGFEGHVQSDPKHKIRKERGGKNFLGVLLGFLFLGYAVSPGIIPYYSIFGWFDNLFALIFGMLFLIKGWNGKSPVEALGDIF